MWLLSIDDFTLSDYGIPPAMLTNKSSHLGFGVDRRSGVYGSVFFGASSQPATWHVILQCPTEAARYALIALLAAPRNTQLRLLAQRSPYGEDLVTIEAAITSVQAHGSSDNLEVTFESNDSVWFAEDVATASKTFASPLDQVLHLPVGGNLPTHPVVRLTPTVQRSSPTATVGWRYRQRWTITNGGDEPLFRYPVRLDLGNTATLVSGGKALASGNDLRVWLDGLEQARTLVGWNTSQTYLWLIVPALPVGASLTYDLVYGNASASAATSLAYPDLPSFDLPQSSNTTWYYVADTSTSANAGRGLWYLSSGLGGGFADDSVPGAWSPALTFANPNNTDDIFQSRATRLTDGATTWYQPVLNAARWHGDSFDFLDEYAGGEALDGVVLRTPFGISRVVFSSWLYDNMAWVKTVVTTTVSGTTASDEVETPHDPFTRVVVISRNTGGEDWHIINEYANASNTLLKRLYLSSEAAPITVSPASGWEATASFGLIRRLAQASRPNLADQTWDFPSTATLAADNDYLFAQYVYPLPPDVVFTTSDTVKGQMTAKEGGTAHDFRAQMVIRVMTAAGALRTTLLNFDTAALSSEFSTARENRQFPRGGAVNLAANYTTVAGDYLVIEYGGRTQAAGSGSRSMTLGLGGDLALGDLPEDQINTTYALPWIEFSNDLSGTSGANAGDWSPPTPMKQFGVAVWPKGGPSIPDDANGRVRARSYGDVNVTLDTAGKLLIAQTQAETAIYELATELRLGGGANAVGPYRTLLVGNARGADGPGTPRTAVAFGTQAVELDAERHTHTVWDTSFTVQQEALSAHTVRALDGYLLDGTQGEARTAAWLPVAPPRRTLPNGDLAVDLSSWEVVADDPDLTYAVTHDATIGGEQDGSLKVAITANSNTGAIVVANTTWYSVAGQNAVTVSGWMRVSHANLRPSLVILWYQDGSDTPVAQDDGPVWSSAPTINTGYHRAFAAAVPAGVTRFRVGVRAGMSTTGVTGNTWFDDIRLNDTDLLLADAAMGEVDVTALVRPRWTP